MIRNIFSMMKLRISLLVIITSYLGYYLGLRYMGLIMVEQESIITFINLAIGVFLTSSSSAIFNQYFEINYQNIEIKVFFDKKKLYLSGWETIDAYNNSVFTDIIIYEVNKIVNNNLFNLKGFY